MEVELGAINTCCSEATVNQYLRTVSHHLLLNLLVKGVPRIPSLESTRRVVAACVPTNYGMRQGQAIYLTSEAHHRRCDSQTIVQSIDMNDIAQKPGCRNRCSTDRSHSIDLAVPPPKGSGGRAITKTFYASSKHLELVRHSRTAAGVTFIAQISDATVLSTFPDDKKLRLRCNKRAVGNSLGSLTAAIGRSYSVLCPDFSRSI